MKKTLIYIFISMLISCDGEPDVYISISASDYRKLELNWYDLGNLTSKARIGLYDHQPTESKDKSLLEIIPQSTDGFYKTNISFGDFPNSLKAAQKCLGYWIALTYENDIELTSCFKFNPTWMEDHQNYLANQSLKDIVIPATHDSGAVLSSFPKSVIERFTIAQEVTIWQQLLFGIRFLDIRPAVSAIDNDFYIKHGDFYLHSKITEVISIIKKFLTLTTNEIIIVQLQLFRQGFQGEAGLRNHRRLIRLFMDEFEASMVPENYGASVTLAQLWKENKRLLVTYKNPIYKEYPLIWDHALSTYGGTVDLSKLKMSIQRDLPKLGDDKLKIISGELTPQIKTVVDGFFNRTTSLRFFASVTNRPLGSWLRHDFRDSVNIVMADFVLSSNIVNFAIQENCRRSLNGTEMKNP